jgi:hypothetical protein
VVQEVPAFLSHRERKKRPARGKSDVDDAIAIARVVARGEGLSSPQRSDELQDLKLLSNHGDQLVRARTQLINRTHRDLVVSHPGYERELPKLTSKKKLVQARALLRGDHSIRGLPPGAGSCVDKALGAIEDVLEVDVGTTATDDSTGPPCIDALRSELEKVVGPLPPSLPCAGCVLPRFPVDRVTESYTARSK